MNHENWLVQIYFHIWLPLKELEPKASTNLSNLLRHTASLYLRFRAILYRTHEPAINHENYLPWGPNVFSYLATASCRLMMFAPSSAVHCSEWASLYLQFETILYRIRWLAMNRKIACLAKWVLISPEIES